ncbi:MAG: glycosyltransferase [Fuerstiella sp.]
MKQIKLPPAQRSDQHALPAPVKLSEQLWPDGTVPTVSICCITFNQEAFIRDAIDGFLMQTTTFPVEILIHDDASKDSTGQIVAEYAQRHPKLIRPILQSTNQYSQGQKIFPIVFSMARGNLLAMCEGDDVWTDPMKLQRQVECLQGHINYVGSCHAAVYQQIDVDGSVTGDFVKRFSSDEITLSDLLCSNPITTCSVVIRREYMPHELPADFDALKFGDLPRWALAAVHGPFAFDSRVMSTYRQHPAGMWSRLSDAAAARAMADYGLLITGHLSGSNRIMSVAAGGRLLGDAVFQACRANDQELLCGLVGDLSGYPWNETQAAYINFISSIGEKLALMCADDTRKLTDAVSDLLNKLAEHSELSGQFDSATRFLSSYVLKRQGDHSFERGKFREARNLYTRAAISGTGKNRKLALILAFATYGGRAALFLREWARSFRR